MCHVCVCVCVMYVCVSSVCVCIGLCVPGIEIAMSAIGSKAKSK